MEFRYLVIAWNFREFQEWCYDHQLNWRKQKYCRDFRDVLGIHKHNWKFVWLEAPEHWNRASCKGYNCLCISCRVQEYLCDHQIESGPGSRWGCAMKGL